jgi:hypothetical protein
VDRALIALFKEFSLVTDFDNNWKNPSTNQTRNNWGDD